MKDLPHLASIYTAWQLIRSQGLLWMAVACFSFIFCFKFCPANKELSRVSTKTAQQRAEIMTLIKKIDQLQTKKHFALEQNEFFMERLIREEFNLKRISPTQNL